jgi:hypothetical protein
VSAEALSARAATSIYVWATGFVVFAAAAETIDEAVAVV